MARDVKDAIREKRVDEEIAKAREEGKKEAERKAGLYNTAGPSATGASTPLSMDKLVEKYSKGEAVTPEQRQRIKQHLGVR